MIKNQPKNANQKSDKNLIRLENFSKFECKSIQLPKLIDIGDLKKSHNFLVLNHMLGPVSLGI